MFYELKCVAAEQYPQTQPLRASLADTPYRSRNESLGRYGVFARFFGQTRPHIGGLAWKTDLDCNTNPRNGPIYGGPRGGWGPNPIRSSASPPPVDVKSSSRQRVWARGMVPTGRGRPGWPRRKRNRVRQLEPGQRGWARRREDGGGKGPLRRGADPGELPVPQSRRRGPPSRGLSPSGTAAAAPPLPQCHLCRAPTSAHRRCWW
jgi:hypothetical protein